MIVPGGKDRAGAEWVGLVKYKPSTISDIDQPAAVKLTLKPTDMLSTIPTYKATGEMRVAGHSQPITLEIDKLITGHLIQSVD